MMREKGKKLSAILLTGAVSVSVMACGSSTPDKPSNSEMQKDVQEYITEMVDPEATLSYFQVTDSETGKKEVDVVCEVKYESSTVAYQDEFDLTYDLTDGEWELSKCKINADYAQRSSESVQGGQEADAGTAAPETAAPQEEAAAPETAAPQAEAAAGQVSDKLEDFTFQLEGKVYTLPFPYQTLVADGWTLDSYGDESEEDELAANSYEFYRVTNGSVSININIINMSGDVKKMKDCQIGSIEVEAKDNLDFAIAKGITCTSTKDEIQAAYGTPNNSNSGDGYESMKYEVDSYQYYRFYLNTEHSTNNSITVQNYSATEADATEVSDEVPEYLSTYVAPTELGNDPETTAFNLDGALYQLPCPISAFTDNGWEISSIKIQSLGAKNKDGYAMELKKGEKKLYIGLLNFSKKAALAQNCAVYSVEFDSSVLKGAADDFVQFPAGLSFGTGKDQVESTCTGFEKYESDASVSYTYNNTGYTKKVRYYFYENGDYSSHSIEMENEEWNY